MLLVLVTEGVPLNHSIFLASNSGSEASGAHQVLVLGIGGPVSRAAIPPELCQVLDLGRAQLETIVVVRAVHEGGGVGGGKVVYTNSELGWVPLVRLHIFAKKH